MKALLFNLNESYNDYLNFTETYLLYVPINIPLSHIIITPSLHHVSNSQVYTDQTVVSDAQNFILTTALKPEKLLDCETGSA